MKEWWCLAYLCKSWIEFVRHDARVTLMMLHSSVTSASFSIFKTSENVLAFFVATHHIHFCTVA